MLLRPLQRSRFAVLVIALALALGGLAATGGTSDAAERAVAPSVSPARPMVGERTTFSGALRGPGRPVALQRRSGSTWQTVANGRVSKANRYTLAHRVTRTATYRVTAKRYRGKRPFTSGNRTVSVIGQQVSLDLSATPFVLNRQRTVRAVVQPVRKGREVVLQRKVGSGNWTNVVLRRTNSAGVASLPYTGTSRGNASYRAIARTFHGSSAKGSVASVVATVRTTELVSPGAPADGASYPADVSSEGRWVAMYAEDPLLPTDTDGLNDIYLMDRRTGVLEHLVPQANGHTNRPFVSANGRYVAFQSLASNLTPGITDGNGGYDVFVLDRSTGEVELASARADGAYPSGNSYAFGISDDGNLVAYTSTATDLVTLFGPPNTTYRHAYLRDRNLDVPDSEGLNRPLDRVGLGWSEDNIYDLELAAGGTAVAFSSGDPDLDPGNVSGSAIHRWRINADGSLDTDTGRENLTPGKQATTPSLSHDGSIMAFESQAALVGADNDASFDVYVRSAAGTFSLVTGGPTWTLPNREPEISGNGRYVAFSTRNVVSGDTNADDRDVLVADLDTEDITLITAAGIGFSDQPLLTRDGSLIVFGSEAAAMVPEQELGVWNGYATVLR